MTYTVKIVFNGVEECISGLTYEQATARAESASRSYGISADCHMKDGRVFVSGDDSISIISSNGFCSIEEIYSWGCNAEELALLRQTNIVAVEKYRRNYHNVLKLSNLSK